MANTPRQILQDFVEFGDASGFPEGNYEHSIAALGALYIGDGLREVAQAITNYTPILPTDAQIEERVNSVLAVIETLTGGTDLDEKAEQAIRVVERVVENIGGFTKGAVAITPQGTGMARMYCPVCLSNDVVCIKDTPPALLCCGECLYQDRPSAFYQKTWA